MNTIPTQKLIYAFILGCLFGMPAVLQAATVNNFYQVSTVVDDQSKGQRLKGFSDAAKQMLVRLSGSPTILEAPELSAVIALPSRYVQGYRYEQRAPAVDKQSVLVVNFQPQALENLLVSQGLPVWSKNRPEVLMWLAVEGKGGRYIAKDVTTRESNQLVKQAAQRRGLPVIWPLSADVDAGKVKLADVKGGFVGAIQRASEDYQAQGGIVLGHLRQLSTQRWQGTWQLLRNGQMTELVTEQGQFQDVIDLGIDALANTLAQEFAVAVDDQTRTEPLRVDVQAVHSLSRYAQAREYLDKLLMTERVDVVHVSPDHVAFQMTLRGTKQDFLRAIQLGRSMRVVQQQTGAVVVGNNVPDVVLELL